MEKKCCLEDLVVDLQNYLSGFRSEVKHKDKMIFDIFRGKTVLITGHTGFKGAWLTLWLNKLGANITGIALDPSNKKNAFSAMNIASLCNDIRQDINAYEEVIKFFNEVKPEIVFHLAAQSLVLESYENPLYTFNTNIIGTVNILEACRLTPSVKTIIIVTSDKCYENKEWIYAYRENDRLGGKDPYSASKSCVEQVVNSYRHSFFNQKQYCSLASVRAGNVIGGGDWADNRIVPDCIKFLKKGEAVNLRNPTAVRPWQYVLEPLRGYLLLAVKMINEPDGYNEAWNFGPGYDEVRDVEDLTSEVIKFWGSGIYKTANKIFEKQETRILKLDISKTSQKLKWRPVLSFNESVKMTVDWYKSQLTNEDMLQFSREQINYYETLIQNKSF